MKRIGTDPKWKVSSRFFHLLSVCGIEFELFFAAVLGCRCKTGSSLDLLISSIVINSIEAEIFVKNNQRRDKNLYYNVECL